MFVCVCVCACVQTGRDRGPRWVEVGVESKVEDDDERSDYFIRNDGKNSISEDPEEVQSQKSKNSTKIQNISTISAKPILNATQTQQAKNVIPQKKPEKTTAGKQSFFFIFAKSLTKKK